MSSIQNNDMKTIGSTEPDYTSSSYPSTSTLGRTMSFGPVSNSRSSSEPPSKRRKLEADWEESKEEITIAQLKEMEIRGTLLRPIYGDKLSELKNVPVENMFDIRNASLPAIIVSNTDIELTRAIILEGCHRISTVLDLDCSSNGYSNFRIDIIMYEVEEGVFTKAWAQCLPLKFSESFKSESSVSSRVELDSIPTVILNIGMQIHSNEEFRTKGVFNTHDSAFFTFKFLERTTSDAELTKMRTHPQERGTFWNRLVKEGRVLASGNSQLPMLPLFVLLMMPKSQKETVRKLKDGSFPTGNRLVKLHNSLQLILEKAAGNVDKEKSEESDFHEKIEEIDSSSICFFFARLPTEEIPLMIEKSQNIIVAEPSGETIHQMSKWPVEQKTTAILNNVIYGGEGQPRLVGERLLPRGLRHLAPMSSRKLSNFVSKWFPGQSDGEIHTVRGFLTVPE
ncbi:hypothetical protein CRE_31012 [Caenorhabditis remanei]|uniref:Uncharacterized protein n=1 Tax=Caenorhabditis remanei TaxID=31234 RepID=E3LU40_CAERE|nr:hypothetical protein CRE_31012 [Caenorhabditis remanei]